METTACAECSNTYADASQQSLSHYSHFMGATLARDSFPCSIPSAVFDIESPKQFETKLCGGLISLPVYCDLLGKLSCAPPLGEAQLAGTTRMDFSVAASLLWNSLLQEAPLTF